MKVLVYGSLRKDEYNYNRFLQYYPDEINYIKTLTIEGFDLYSLGPYPAIVKGEGSLVVDLLDVSPEVKESFDGMELGAGYEIQQVEVDNELVDIYVYVNPQRLNNNRKVQSGDWSKYLKNENIQVEV